MWCVDGCWPCSQRPRAQHGRCQAALRCAHTSTAPSSLPRWSTAIQKPSRRAAAATGQRRPLAPPGRPRLPHSMAPACLDLNRAAARPGLVVGHRPWGACVPLEGGVRPCSHHQRPATTSNSRLPQVCRRAKQNTTTGWPPIDACRSMGGSMRPAPRRIAALAHLKAWGGQRSAAVELGARDRPVKRHPRGSWRWPCRAGSTVDGSR